jgi:hypothetical protein
MQQQQQPQGDTWGQSSYDGDQSSGTWYRQGNQIILNLEV